MATKFFRKTNQRRTTLSPKGHLSGGAAALSPAGLLSRVARLSCLLVLLTATFCAVAQNGIEVSGLVVTAGSPASVTFNVSWNKNTMPQGVVWSDTVWVFVDHNVNGKMERMEVTGAKVSAGEIAQNLSPGNTKGVFVAGYARSAGAGGYSATVTLATSQSDMAGVCAYVSNYRPVANFSSGAYNFTGTPMYDLELKLPGGSTTYTSSSSPFYLPPGYTLLSFTDATGAPGIISCISSSAFTLLASAPGFCAGDAAGVVFSLSGTESGRKYQLYRDGATVGAVLSGTGSAATFTGGPFNVAGSYTARSVQDGSYCEVVMNGSHSIVSNSVPEKPVINADGDKCLNSGDLVFTASSYSGVVEWRSVSEGGTTATNSVTFASGSTGTKSVTARSAQTYSGAPTCYSTTVTKSASVHGLPTVTSPTGASRCGAGTVVLTATPSDDAVIDWYDAASSGLPLTNGTATSSFTTPQINTSTTYYAEARTTAGCLSLVRTAVLATVHTAPTAPTGLSSSVSRICNGMSTSVILTANNGNVGSGAVYEWGSGSTVGSSSLTTTAGNTYSVSLSGTAIYWARLKGTTSCSDVTGGVTVTIGTYSAVSPGSITSGSATTNAGTAPIVTIENSSTASGGSDNLTYLWVRTGGTGAATLTGSNNATYALSADAANYATAGTYYFNRYAKDATCSNTAWVAASGTYTLGVEATGTNQPQGSCPFTQPAVVGTFASFPSTYSASTYVTLTDERDSKNYTVVKINNRWVMAQNLNYQKNLSHQTNPKQPTESASQPVTALIGHFWCPGGVNGNTATSSTLASCDVWGALYSWETAMMVDGKWSDDNRSATGWSEPGYSTNTGSANTNNGGRGANGHGICPSNWHVPTDGEWGDILNAMETESGTKDHNSNTGYRGTAAGSRGKSVCTCASNGCNNDTDVSWSYYASNQGTDVCGFRVLPAGLRLDDGSYFANRGYLAYFWSSSAASSTNAWYRIFHYYYATVARTNNLRSYGFSVRCIRDAQ